MVYIIFFISTNQMHCQELETYREIEIANKLEVKKAKLYEVNQDNFKEREKLRRLKNGLFQFELNLKNAKDIYEKNKYEKLIIQQKNKIENFNLKLKNTSIISQEIAILKDKLDYNEVHSFTGNLKVFSVPKNDEDFELAQK